MSSPYSLDAALTWNNVILGPDAGPSNKPTFAVLTNDFGDGYINAVGDGLNNVRDTWAVTWSNLPPVIGDAVELFLRTMAGFTPFMWTPPKGSIPKQYRCNDYTRSDPDPGVVSIQATIVQDFAL